MERMVGRFSRSPCMMDNKIKFQDMEGRNGIRWKKEMFLILQFVR